MKHGYTNRTDRQGATVRKVYDGPDAAQRQARERLALEALRGRFPVPRITGTGPGWLATEFVAGAHGQDLIDAGQAASVLAGCGRVLRQLHSLDPRLIAPGATGDVVIQHGDFGPNNLLFGAEDGRVMAALDWEFSGVGEAITDIAWCEWIVRMHHPESVYELPAFFDAYGSKPSWTSRQDEMVRRCRWLEDFTTQWDPAGPAAAVWRDRIRTVQHWEE